MGIGVRGGKRLDNGCGRAIPVALTILCLVLFTAANTAVLAENTQSSTLAHNDTSSAAINVLSRYCFSCHGAEKAESGLRMDSRQGIISGGDRGSALNTDRPDQSLLLKVILGQVDELEMPPKQPLSAEHRQILSRWIQSGASWPNQGISQTQNPPESAVHYGSALVDPQNPVTLRFGGERLDLWSLRSIATPTLPAPQLPGWAENSLDSFVLADWESQGRLPAPDVDRRVLARRMSFDLIGLPPTFDEVERFVHDPRPDATHRYADRLIASASYGEHWARMWLDVVRYSDSNGFDWDEFRPQAWRYRDYVVRSLNRDLPFDQFVTQQLAGDELLTGPPTNLDEQDCLLATGYLRVGPHDNSAASFNEQDRSRAELLADLTETTGSAMLGMTLSCCRCHDHKTDPLTHEDHYRLRAFFSAVEFADSLPIDLADQQQRIAAHNAPFDKRLEAIELELKELAKEAAADRKRLEAEKKELQSKKLSYTHALVMTDRPGDVPATYVLYQGDHRAERQRVEPGFPTVLYPNTMPLSQAVNTKTTGRRLSLARWITSPDNPWTARVIVNRLWQMYFGDGLVATPNDFGLSGAPPKNLKLLDWLSAELIRNRWSLKYIQRLIVTSHTYRLASISDEVQARGGTTPRIASYRNALRRLSAEQLRDAALAVSGLLQNRVGGPPIWPELPNEILQANPAFLDDNASKTKGWYPSSRDQQSVRSLYLVQKRTVRIPLLETFDLPENSTSSAKRDCSIVAPQALSWFNGSLTKQASQALSLRIESASEPEPESADDDQSTARRAALTFQFSLQRNPTSVELEAACAFLRSHSLAELCRAMLNTNEFVFIE